MIKLHETVFVLAENVPCMFVFKSDLVLTNRLTIHNVFYIDREYNIVMSDYSNHCVYVFNQEGEQIHKFGEERQGIGEFYSPCEIALNSSNTQL